MNATKTQVLEEAHGHERIAYYWASRENDWAYLDRINFTPAQAEYQSKIAAYFAAQAYERAASMVF